MKGKLFIFSDKSLMRDKGLKKTTEPELRSLGIESKGYIPPAYVAWRKRFLGSLNVYKFGRWMLSFFTDKKVSRERSFKK